MKKELQIAVAVVAIATVIAGHVIPAAFDTYFSPLPTFKYPSLLPPISEPISHIPIYPYPILPRQAIYPRDPLALPPCSFFFPGNDTDTFVPTHVGGPEQQTPPNPNPPPHAAGVDPDVPLPSPPPPTFIEYGGYVYQIFCEPTPSPTNELEQLKIK